MATLYFVRHGVTKNNKIYCFNGSGSDPELLDEGKQQAARLGMWLSQVSFSAVYVSPATRAKQTAHEILHSNTFKRDEVQLDQRLKEISFGSWDGDLVERHEDHPEFKNYLNAPDRYDPASFGGESYQEVLDRGQTFIEQLDLAKEANILIVGHGVMLTTLLRSIVGTPLAQIRDEKLLDNASLTILSGQKVDDLTTEKWNFTAY